MMVVCRGFNQILSTNPSLWRIVDLDKETPNKSAFEIIETFAARSRNTLVAIKTPEKMDKGMNWLAVLLQRSKATLRRLDLNFFDNQVFDAGRPIISFFHLFLNIERLNLTSRDLPEAEKQIPGVLTMFACDHSFMNAMWSPEYLNRFRSVKYLCIRDVYSLQDNGCLHPALQACSSNLEHLSLGPVITSTPLEFDLPKLLSLELKGLGGYSGWLFTHSGWLFTRPLPSLKHLKGPPMMLDGLSTSQLESVKFEIEVEAMDGRPDERLSSVETMITIVKESSATLRLIKLKAGRVGRFGLDPFLRTLKVDYLSPSCPLLTDLYIDKGQEFSLDLLAEVMVSRNLASKGWEFKGEDEGDDDEEDVEIGGRNCSKLVLHLDASGIKEFKKAEKKILYRIPKWMKRQAGRTEVREWIGK